MQNQNTRSATKNKCIEVFFSAQTAPCSPPFVFEAPEFGLIAQLLDVGGGSGLMASLLKQCNPHLKITIFDRKDLCEAALDLFRETAQSDDLGAHAGNILVDPFPSGFEAIQLSGILETLRPGQIRALLRKAFDALPRGGLLLIYGRMDLRALAPKASSPFAPWAAPQYRDWLHCQGFTLMACRRCPGRHVLLSAVK